MLSSICLVFLGVWRTGWNQRLITKMQFIDTAVFPCLFWCLRSPDLGSLGCSWCLSEQYWKGLGKQLHVAVCALAVLLSLDLCALGVWEGPVVPRPLITHPGGIWFKVFISIWLCPGSKFWEIWLFQRRKTVWKQIINDLKVGSARCEMAISGLLRC